jgi:hypothetical protein
MPTVCILFVSLYRRQIVLSQRRLLYNIKIGSFLNITRMTIQQERQQSMMMTLVSYLGNNSAITATLPHFLTYFNPLKDTVDEIGNIAQLQADASNTGNAQTKADVRRRLIAQADTLTTSIRSYALFTHNTLLRDRVATNLGKLKGAADTTFLGDCRTYHTIATGIGAPLAPYGIDTPFLADMEIDMDDFAVVLPQPRLAIVSKTAHTEALVTLFAKAKEYIDGIEGLVMTKRQTLPAFYSQYKNAAKVTNNSGRTMALRIAVNAIDGTGLRHFTLSFVRESDGETFEYTTNANGTMHRRLFKAGAYTLTITKIDYTPFVGRLVLDPSETFDLDVVVDTTAMAVVSAKNRKTGMGV